uniref:Putative RNA-binding protein Luc7-like 1 n=1 Tax=Sinocyclocheilus anshuiensis TaxID=1608454 RepID=A0A671KAM7_9TELE
MSAQAQMRAMLDQLMGTGRDGDTMRQRIKFTDERVCKSHLLESCPHDILSGTRMDLGECVKIHDLALRADYEIASKQQEYFFELDATEHLQSFIADCDRRTELAKKRLAETQEEISAEVAAKAERVHELNEEIGKLLARAEQLGGEGNVEEAQQVLEKVEKTRTLKKEAEDIYRNSMPASSFQQQKLRVCEVCSAYLGLHDNDRRLADHFGGKLHIGFIEIREKLEKLNRSACARGEERSATKRRSEPESGRWRKRGNASGSARGNERESASGRETERENAGDSCKHFLRVDTSRSRSGERYREGGSSSSHRSRRHREDGERERDRERKHRHKDHHRSRSHSHRSKRKRSSHTRDQEQPLSRERWQENAADERWWDNGRRDMEREGSPVSPDMSRMRERERSVSLERDQRSSSEERESGEI